MLTRDVPRMVVVGDRGSPILICIGLEMNDSCCLVCLSSFSIVNGHHAYRCIMCEKRICYTCLKDIKIWICPNQSYQCMFCSKNYNMNTFPERDKKLLEKLHQLCFDNYAVEQTKRRLGYDCMPQDFVSDVNTRLQQLDYLTMTANNLQIETFTSETLCKAEKMTKDLSSIVKEIKNESPVSETLKQNYRQSITKSCYDSTIRDEYINVCEEFMFEISIAEET